MCTLEITMIHHNGCIPTVEHAGKLTSNCSTHTQQPIFCLFVFFCLYWLFKAKPWKKSTPFPVWHGRYKVPQVLWMKMVREGDICYDVLVFYIFKLSTISLKCFSIHYPGKYWVFKVHFLPCNHSLFQFYSALFSYFIVEDFTADCVQNAPAARTGTTSFESTWM